jgi:Fur family transcriptional regulator, ferric uptake regulator
MKRRNTDTKSAILNSLKNSREALSHDRVQAGLDMEVDRATIYRVLNRFSEDGIVHRVVGDDGKQYFAVCTTCSQHQHQHNHFHFRCRNCGKVECLPNEIVLEIPAGYQAETFNGFISGLCPGCTQRPGDI